MFTPLDNATSTQSIGSTGVQLQKPVGADAVLVQNIGSSVLLIGYQGMPEDTSGFPIPANTAAELRILTQSVYLKRKVGSTAENAIISFGVHYE